MNESITPRRKARSIGRHYGTAMRTGWLLALTLAAATSATAAQIDITNCQPKQVRICALDEGPNEDPFIQVPTWTVVGDRILSQGDTKHFTCNARCKFWISNPCSGGDCPKCLGKHGTFLNHRWGKGAYQLVSLDMTDDGSYVSTDLIEVEAGAQCR